MTGSVPGSLTYALVTPVRDEAEGLERLAADVVEQTVEPMAWVIVDTGSRDGTVRIARRLAGEIPWVTAVSCDSSAAERGGPIVRAFVAGIDAMAASGITSDVVVKLDGDLGLGRDYFARQLKAFADDGRLGISSGVCHELRHNRWVPFWGTRDHVWGAARAYRAECLAVVRPLPERQGWDEVDALKARLLGWKTGVVADLPFKHYRTEGERDGQWRRWADKGDSAYYMGYRPSYLVARTLYRARREPSALLMLPAYARAAVVRSQRLPDENVRRFLREQQRLRVIGARRREVRGPGAET